MSAARWSRCIVQTHGPLDRFFAQYLGGADRRVFLLAAAGFDPRSLAIVEHLAALPRTHVTALWLRERRPVSITSLRARAESHAERLRQLFPESSVVDLAIFAPDGAPIGGREVVRLLQGIDLSEFTDIAIDVSAFSTGVFYSATKFLYERVRTDPRRNLHLFVTKDDTVDFRIRGTPSDTPIFVHGFRGTFTLDASARAAKLWLPQLIPGRRMMLQNLQTFLDADDVCPVLPFPAADPRLGEKLVEEYRETLARWGVDFRNFVYAAENDPRDLYEKILRLHAARRDVFAEAGGSLLVLSPTGSKILSLGALLAALDLDLPVALYESVGYELEPVPTPPPPSAQTSYLMHLWLHGVAYPPSPAAAPLV
jgi:hypothetical protein